MPQGTLPYQYQAAARGRGATSYGGVLPYFDLAQQLGMVDAIERHLSVRVGGQGWTDRQCVMSLVLLNLCGGDAVEDIESLEADEGLSRVVRHWEVHGLRKKERRAAEARFRRGRQRTFPSPSALFRFLEEAGDEEKEAGRGYGRSFVPEPTPLLAGLQRANLALVASVQRNQPRATATLDLDATFVPVEKRGAYRCYKGYPAFSAFNVYWAEQDLVVRSQFRDGNVTPSFGQLAELKAALRDLPSGVKQVRVRVDTAGYEWELLRYCAEGQNERFGVMEYAIGVDVTAAFKAAVLQVPESEWHPLRDESGGALRQEWAEVCFVPNEMVEGPCEGTYRFLAVREPLRQQALPGVEQAQEELPFATIDVESQGLRHRYKLTGLVTNLEGPGEEVIRFSRGRCGKGEEIHAIQKDDFAGGRLPSGKFGANAAWWRIMVLAQNLAAAMRHLVLSERWATRRMKGIRHGLLRVAGWVSTGGRSLKVWLRAGHPASIELLAARRRILALVPAGPGPPL